MALFFEKLVLQVILKYETSQKNPKRAKLLWQTTNNKPNSSETSQNYAKPPKQTK